MALIRPLSDIGLGDLAAYGGKAARLGNALQLGCPVLPGIVLSTDLYRSFMRQGGLSGEIASILDSMQPSAVAHFQAVEWAIHSAFKVRALPDDVSDTLAEAWQVMDSSSIAVRSSATREDSPEQSFVGQHATYLDVDSLDALMEAVLGCWVSLFSAKALSYAQHFGVDLVNSSMAIVLQPMIERTQHGALFTVDPISGNPDRFIIEVNLGSRVGVHRLNPYQRAPGEDRYWSQLRHYGLRVDEHEDAFQAIEWAIANDELYLMRVRPVTPVPPYLPTGRLQIRETDEPLYLVRPPGDRSRPLRPHSWFHRSRASEINAARYRHANRLYSPYASREEQYIKGYQYARKQAFPQRRGAAKRLGRLVRDLQLLSAARTPLRTAQHVIDSVRPTLVELAKTDPGAMRKQQLASQMQQVLDFERTLCAHGTRVRDVSTAVCEVHQRLYAHLTDSPPQGYLELLSSDNDRLSQAYAELKRCALAANGDSDAAHIAKEDAFTSWQYLYLSENPLAEWRDVCHIHIDRNLFDQDWQNFSNSNSDPDQIRTFPESKLPEEGLLKLPALQTRLYDYVLEMAQRYRTLVGDYDEALRLCLWAEHRMLQDVGRRLVAQGLTGHIDDACLLEYKEVTAWLRDASPRDDIVRQLIERRDLQRRWNRYVPAPVLRNSPRERQITDSAQGTHTIWYGRPISRGYARGHARVASSLLEASTILPGEILVCRAPFFEMTPLFRIISAVISESGGLLDHAGVLAREYAIPAVFGVKNATSEIRTGDDIEVNGAQGLLVRHPQDESWHSFAS